MNIPNENTSNYITSDAFNYQDLELIRKTIRMFGFTNILLDRKCEPICGKKYRMSCQERSEILQTELKENGIGEYRIIPIDISFQDTVEKNGIESVVMCLQSEIRGNYTVSEAIRQMTGIETVMINLKNTVPQDIENLLFKQDSSMRLCEKYMPLQSFSKYKMKNTRKIGIVSKNEEKTSILRNVLEERGYEILDVDKMMVSKKRLNVEREIGNFILNRFGQVRFIKYNGMKDGGMSKIFTQKAYVQEDQNLLEEGENLSEYDYVLKNGENFNNRAIEFANTGIRQRKWCK